jgi:hypothetical protein
MKLRPVGLEKRSLMSLGRVLDYARTDTDCMSHREERAAFRSKYVTSRVAGGVPLEMRSLMSLGRVLDYARTDRDCLSHRA